MLLEGSAQTETGSAAGFTLRTCSQSRKPYYSEYKAARTKIRANAAPELEGPREDLRVRSRPTFKTTRPTFYHTKLKPAAASVAEVGGNREMMFFIFVLLLFAASTLPTHRSYSCARERKS